VLSGNILPPRQQVKTYLGEEMSFRTSLTGLNASFAKLDVTNNNISNANTTGFKKSHATFSDIYSSSMSQSNSTIVGQGALSTGTTQQFTQGSLTSSDNMLDLSIQGQGFFSLKPDPNSTERIFTRAGSFSVTNDRYVVDSNGNFLQAFAVNNDDSINLTEVENMKLPDIKGNPAATTYIKAGLNLPSSAPILNVPFNREDPSTYNESTTFDIYDSAGNAHITSTYFIKSGSATENDPTNRWITKTFIGENELTPALMQAKDTQGNELWVDANGRVKTEPQAQLIRDSSMGSYANFSIRQSTTPAAGDSLAVTIKGLDNGNDLTITYTTDMVETAAESTAGMVLALNNNVQFSQEYQATSGAENNILIKRANGDPILQADQAGFDTAPVISGDTVSVTIQGLTNQPDQVGFMPVEVFSGDTISIRHDDFPQPITLTADSQKSAIETAALVRDQLNADPDFIQTHTAFIDNDAVIIAKKDGTSADPSKITITSIALGNSEPLNINTFNYKYDEKAITFTAGATHTASETAALVRDQLNADPDFVQTYNAYLNKGSVIIEKKDGSSADPTKISVTEVNLGNSESGFTETRSVSVFKHAELGISVGPTTAAVVADGQLGFTDADPLYIDENGNETNNISDTLFTFSPYNLERGEIIFDANDGRFIYPNEPMQFATHNFNNGSEPINLELDLSENTTQYSTPFIMRTFNQNGFSWGVLDNLNITDSGIIHANYSNGQQRAIGQIALTSFLNNNGLQQLGNASYTETADTGALQIGVAGSNGFGKISNSNLESSNVDLTTEMINLITTQRNIQANSKALETNSQFQKIIMDELT